MEQEWLAAVIFVLIAAAAALAALWHRALRDRSDTARLAQTGANEAHARFTAFAKYGEESDYWGGVAGFYAFAQAAALLSGGAAREDSRALYADVYGVLLTRPERARLHMAAVLDAMAALADDPGGQIAETKLAELRDMLSE